jgi:hypothetical protein
MLLRQIPGLHPSTIHEIALLIYGGVYAPIRKPCDIQRFFKMAGMHYYCNIVTSPGNSTGSEIIDKIVELLGRFNTGAKNGETGFPQLSPELELIIKYLVDPREYERDLNVVNSINVKLNDVLKFEKISVLLDESNGYSPRIVPYSRDMMADLTDSSKLIRTVSNMKRAAYVKKQENQFNIKYTFYSIFGMILVVLIVLVITNFSKAVFSGIDVILLFAIVSIVVLPLFGFGLDIFTKGEYRRFLENIFSVVKQIRQ